MLEGNKIRGAIAVAARESKFDTDSLLKVIDLQPIEDDKALRDHVQDVRGYLVPLGKKAIISSPVSISGYSFFHVNVGSMAHVLYLEDESEIWSECDNAALRGSDKPRPIH